MSKLPPIFVIITILPFPKIIIYQTTPQLLGWGQNSVYVLRQTSIKELINNKKFINKTFINSKKFINGKKFINDKEVHQRQEVICRQFILLHIECLSASFEPLHILLRMTCADGTEDGKGFPSSKYAGAEAESSWHT